MEFSPRQSLAIMAAVLGFWGVFSVVQLLDYGLWAWWWVAGYAVIAAVLFGPVAWLYRDRVPEQRRKTLAYIGFGVGFLLAVLLFAFLYAFQWTFLASLFFFDAMILGLIVAFVVVWAVEWVAVPVRLRTPELRKLSEDQRE